jgi:hypothetical protein
MTPIKATGALFVLLSQSSLPRGKATGHLTQVPQLGDRGKFFSLFLIGESCFLGQINGSPAGG